MSHRYTIDGERIDTDDRDPYSDDDRDTARARARRRVLARPAAARAAARHLRCPHDRPIAADGAACAACEDAA